MAEKKKMKSYRFHQRLIKALEKRVSETNEKKTRIIEKGLEQQLLKSGHLKKPIF